MEDQSKENIAANTSQKDKDNEESTNIVNDNEERIDNAIDKQKNPTSVSMAINNNSIDEKEKVNKVNIDIVNTDIKDDNIYETVVDVKIEDFDSYADENNKIYKKYNLRKDRKLKATNLNEDKLLQDFQKFNKINSKSHNTHFNCDLCPEVFESKQLLTYHQRIHRSKNLYTCLYCQTVFEKNSDLLEHKEIHENEKCFVCTTCEMAFSSEIAYLRHTYSHSKPPYKCKECLFTTKEITSIKAHLIVHSDNKIKCDICNQTVLKRHMCNHKVMHNTNIVCGECGKIVKSKKSFDYHMISHTGVKPFQCLYCAKGFATSCQLKVHTYIHTGERVFECKICHMKFKQQTDLKRHSVVHFDKSFECDHCGKKFLHKESIKFHLRLHTNYKPYKCPECPMSFVTGTHLTNHTYRRHMDQRFSCDVCNVKFYIKKDYSRHLKCKSHQNKMFGYNSKGT